MEFNEKNEIMLKWENMVDIKNLYQFGEEEIDMEQFISILKRTYELICALKRKFISGQCEASDIFDFAELISVMSKYIPDTCIDDESENHLFTITCLLTDALIDFVLSSSDFWIDDEIIKADGVNCPHKICYITDDNECLIYDFDTGDYSEFITYANRED